MHKNNKLICFLAFLFLLNKFLLSQSPLTVKAYSTVISGDQQINQYLPLLKNKRVAIITNVTGMIGNTSLVDTLVKLKVNVKRIFGPEHGFRSDSDAGETVKNNKDAKTGIPVISLYGSNKKPTKEQLKDIDIVLYDIQDIGARFYTYISTMSYAMEACAENNKEFIVLDRPNPNGFYFDGPILEDKYKSFLGLHPVPMVYGMTCGEYAQMVNGEGWLKDKIKCRLTVIALKNYDRNCSYEIPVRPSPNIPNITAVLLYPGLALFEGTMMSLGRGTNYPFQVVGHPKYPDTSFSFIPKPSRLNKEPKYFNQRCYGIDLRNDPFVQNHTRKINLDWLKSVYYRMEKYDFFEANFNYHSGNALLQEQIKNRVSEAEIRESWKPGLDRFREIRKKYLLYPDFK
ncbi:MAG: DUF1343 domain-containing protein [Bacteroidia bacterium]|nr:DUF1343 domain-containing protein [Bacteroidia bacterium]